MELVAALLTALCVVVASTRIAPEWAVAIPAAVLALLIGAVTPAEATDALHTVGPTIAFLAVLLILAHLVDALGVFTWLGGEVGRVVAGTRSHHGQWLVVATVGAAAVVTAVLSLDATVVLLCPVVVIAARRLGVNPAPVSYATAHLANSASTLLPVSNLTNLLVFAASGLSFGQFAAAMTLPWVATIAVELAILLWAFRPDFDVDPTPTPASAPETASKAAPFPGYPLAVLALVLVGFAASGAVGIEPVWVALGGVLALAPVALRRRRTSPRALLRAASLGFCAFAAVLVVLVSPLADGSVGRWIAGLLPDAPGYGALLTVAVLSALAANLVNNIPATLLMLGAVGIAYGTPGSSVILAILIGVNVGPNLTYWGSLATLLWRRVAAVQDVPVRVGTFTVVGVLTTVPIIPLATALLWLVAGP